MLSRWGDLHMTTTAQTHIVKKNVIYLSSSSMMPEYRILNNLGIDIGESYYKMEDAVRRARHLSQPKPDE
jgi:hypothetical protein